MYTAALGFAACHRRDARRYSSTAEGEVNRPRVYKNPSNALQVHVDEEDKTSYLIQVSGSTYKANTLVINESGLYSLILSSKLPTAKAFKRWVTAEVLPQIRKTGGYIPTHDAEGRQLSNERFLASDSTAPKIIQLNFFV